MSFGGGGGAAMSVPAVCCNRANAKACPIKHAAVDALIADSAPAGSRVQSIGVHTYITRGLCGGYLFAPPPVKGCAGRDAALVLGRKVDAAFQRRVNVKLQSNNVELAGRVRKMIGELSLRGIHVVRAQVPVGLAHRGIKVRTELDALGCLVDGSPVVIEIKATAASKQAYVAQYHVACRKRPRLASGDPNSTYVRHMIQVGFGALCVGTQKGVVVISCKDGALSYPLDPVFARRELFEYKWAAEQGKKPAKQAKTMAAWPECDGPLLQALALKPGFETVKTWTKTAALPASVRLTGPAPGQDLVVCLNTGVWSSAKKRAAKESAQAAGGRHMYAVTQGSKRWRAVLLA